MNIVNRQVSELIPYANNAKQHEDAQVDQIAASIKEFGFNNPILLDGDNGVIAGHGRLMAAKKLKLDDVPTIELAHLTGAQKKAYILADNRLGEVNTSWDFDLVSLELESISADMDIELTGFDASFLLEEPDEGLTDEDETPELPDDPVTVLGDIWVMDGHRLICGDSTNINAWDSLNIPDDFIVFTSPPYNIGKSSILREHLETGANNDAKLYVSHNDDMTTSDYLDFINSVYSCAITKCSCVSINIQILAGSKIPIIEFMNQHSDQMADILTWDKKAGPPSINKGVMTSRFEWILIYKNSKHATKSIPYSSWHGNQTNVFELTTPKNQYNDIHKAVFPVDLVKYVAGDLMNRCRGVVDCFMGTGTSIIAAEVLGKSAMGIEMEPAYVDVSVTRWQNYTGKQATLESTGQTFEDVKADRDCQNPVNKSA